MTTSSSDLRSSTSPSTDLVALSDDDGVSGASADASAPSMSRPTRIGDRMGKLSATSNAEPDAEIGPFALGFGSLYITIAFLLAAPAVDLEPRWWTFTLVFAVGSLLLIPASRMKGMIVDGPVILLGLWVAITAIWSLNSVQAVFQVRRDLPLLLAVTFLAGVLPTEATLRAIRRAIWVAMAVTAFALITLPETREHAAGGLYADPYPGWHGYFIHKNVMAPYMVMGLITVLMFDKQPLRRGLTLAGLMVLLIGSDSATGLSAAIMVFALWMWFRVFHNSGGRWTTGYVVSSFAVFACALMAAVASLSFLTGVAGKDLTFSGRTFIWAAVINAIEKRPFFGYGLGSVFFEANAPTREIWRDTGFRIPHSHSGTLDVLLNYGIVGFVLFVVVFVSSVSMGVRLLRTAPVLAEWFLILLAAQFVMGLSENVFLGQWLVYMAAARNVVQRAMRDGEPNLEPPAPSAQPGSLRRYDRAEIEAQTKVPALTTGS